MREMKKRKVKKIIVEINTLAVILTDIHNLLMDAGINADLQVESAQQSLKRLAREVKKWQED